MVSAYGVYKELVLKMSICLIFLFFSVDRKISGINKLTIDLLCHEVSLFFKYSPVNPPFIKYVYYFLIKIQGETYQNGIILVLRLKRYY